MLEDLIKPGLSVKLCPR